MSTLLETPSPVTEEHTRKFREDGYFILERCVPQEHLELLRGNCQGFMDKVDAEMESEGVERKGLNAKGKRYFLHNCYIQKPELGRFIFSELMAGICRATIGGEACLFWDQYVVKGTDRDSAFSWHQDSGYVHLDCPMYITCWVTLDDVTLDNGAVYLLPYSRLGIRTVVKHIKDPKNNDLVGYFGSDPGDPVTIPAGSIAVFSSYVFHRSGPNLTNNLRRVYLPQYSSGEIKDLKGNAWGQAVPFLKGGEIVFQP